MSTIRLTECAFDGVDKRNVAIIDATTAIDLCSPEIYEALTMPLDSRFSALELDGILRIVLTARAHIEQTPTLPSDVASFAAALTILERMCVHDHLLVDTNALKSFDNSGRNYVNLDAFSEVIQTVCIPDRIYGQVATEIQNYLDSVESWNRSSPLSRACTDWRTSFETGWILEQGGDKPYQDYLHGRSRTSFCPALARSDQSEPRTLFYLELAQVAECPVFLSHRKWRSFSYLRKNMQHDAYMAIESIFESHLIESASRDLERDYGLHISIPGPPLLRLIVGNARAKQLSLLESALQIRSQRSAQDFRDMIFEMQKYIIRGGSSLLQIDRRLRELKKIAATWRDKGIGYGTDTEVRTIELEAIPAIGWLFSLLSIGKVNVTLPRLKRAPKYLTFISSWYRL